MNKLTHFIFCMVLFFQCNIVAFIDVAQFQEQLKAEQVEFLSIDLIDIESVKTVIVRMYQLDQDCRKFYIHERDNLEAQNFMTEMDRFHTQIMKEIIAQHGWLTIDQFGKDIDNQAWLLVQHADYDLEFQKYCLDLLTQAIQAGQTNPIHYAYLYDRVSLNLEEFGYKQKYGTQMLILDTGEIILRPYEGTLEEVDKRRKEIGLPSLEEYRLRIYNMYKK